MHKPHRGKQGRQRCPGCFEKVTVPGASQISGLTYRCSVNQATKHFRVPDLVPPCGCG